MANQRPNYDGLTRELPPWIDHVVPMEFHKHRKPKLRIINAPVIKNQPATKLCIKMANRGYCEMLIPISCDKMATGFCPYGDKCLFRHDPPSAGCLPMPLFVSYK
jgi:hypothetical protein